MAGVTADSVNVTFGIRTAHFDAATGFYLNGVATKILGTANHQDAAAVGVAVPDHLQAWRVSKLKEMVCRVVVVVVVVGPTSRAGAHSIVCDLSLR